MRVKWQTWVIFIITIVFCLQILSILYVKRNPVTPKLGTRITLEHYDESKMYKPRSRNDPEHKLCLLVTYRDSLDPRSHGIGRKEQLELFQTEMKHVLGVRNISYTLIVSEQEDGLLFNKGMAFNFGFLMSYQRCDYYIFHDIDMYPQSLLNTYEYPKDGPMHLITSTQYWGGFYNADIAGGVLAMTQEQFIICNGYSNKYWGWGFEDNDIYYRIVNNGLQFYRHETETGYFKVLPHEHGDIGELLARDQTRLSQAYAEFSKRGLVDYSQDGLTTLNATLLEIIADQPDYFHFIHRVHNRDFLLQEDVFDPVQTMKDFYAELSQFYGPVDTSIVFVWNEK